MSRPPRPYPLTEVSAGLETRAGRLEVFAPSFQDLVEMQNRLSVDELDLTPPGGDGDFAATLFGLSAVVAHVLGIYQDFYGGEAFLGTARTEQSLVRHGRRIGYTTDPGVAATGVVVVDVKPGLSGTLPRGLSLLSLPKGEQKSQKYETLDARRVDAKWNLIEPRDQTVTRDTLAANAREIEVDGIDLGLAPGEQVMLVRLNGDGTPMPQEVPRLLTIRKTDEATSRGTTNVAFFETIQLTGSLGDYRLLAKPTRELRLFGWDADPQLFPPAKLRDGGGFISQADDDTLVASTASKQSTTGTTSVTVFEPVFGYVVAGETAADVHDAHDLYLTATLAPRISGTWVLRLDGDGTVMPYFVTNQGTVSVTFIREEKQSTKVQIPDTAVIETTQFVPTWISASTTRIRVRSPGAVAEPTFRKIHDIRSRWLADFALELKPRLDAPNLNAVTEGAELTLLGNLEGLEPGMLAVLTTRARHVAQLIELTHVRVSDASAVATTTIVWKARSAVPSGSAFALSDSVILGNAVRVSHGKRVEEVLGDSDGVTPFLRFALKKSPVTHVPDASGAIPELDVRVGEVLWTRVGDFSKSGPEDRHYIVQRDEAQVTKVCFGDGRKGAVPAAGRRHIRASYREGLGTIGNIDPGRLSRLEKSHPLLLRVSNALPISGGTEPAVTEQVRREATRFIRTFDRAVSATDYADLALLYPGVARARATSSPSSGVTLVAADAEGAAISDLGTFRQYLDLRRDRGLPLVLVGPVAVDITISVRVEYDPAFFDYKIEQAVREVLMGPSATAPGLFTFRGREFGEAGQLSRTYQAINGIDGVLSSEILKFDLAPARSMQASVPQTEVSAGLRDIIVIAAREWLRLLPDNLSIETQRRKN